MTGHLREWLQRAVGFLHGRRVDRDFEAELTAHIELAVEDNLRSGMSPEEARHAAAIQFGSPLAAKERAGDQRGLPWLEVFFKDVGYALRGMRKHPAFTGVVVFTLALGIGANTALFSLVEAVLLRQMPVRDAQSLYFLVNTGAKGGASNAPPYECYQLFRDHTNSFQSMAAFVPDNMNLTIDGRVEQVWGEYASGTYFQVLGVRAAIGRVLTASDDQLQPPVAVLSHTYWQARFGSDPGVIGKTVLIDRKALMIVGVAESGFTGMAPGTPSGIIVPFTVQDARFFKGPNWFFDIVARIKPGVPIAKARAEIDPIFQNYMQPLTDFSPDLRRDYFDHIELLPAARGADTLRRRFGEPLLILMAVVGVVLLVGCSNLASLFMARASTREREFAVRLAIGAGWWRLARQLLTETMLLFGCGAALGLVLAAWGSQMLAGFLSAGRVPLSIDVQLTGMVLAFTVGVALLTGVVFGVVPTLAVVRGDPHVSLHGLGGRGTDPRSRIGMRQALVVAQVALSLTLLVGGGLFVRTLVNLNRLDLGFRPQGVVTMSVFPVDPSYTEARLEALWKTALERVRQVPGVKAASVSVLTPLGGRDRGVRVSVPGYQSGAGGDQLMIQNHVSESYFETFGIPLMAGRIFTTADTADGPRVAVINEAAAKFYFAGRNPLGATVELGSKPKQRVYQIIGIVRDAKHLSMRQETPRFLYLPIAQRRDHLTRLTLAVKTAGNSAGVTAAVEREVRALGSDIAVTEVMTLQQQVEEALLQERLLSTFGGFFSLLALVLSAVGLYGLLAHVVSQRTGEIGIRIALGADRGAVVWMVLRRSLWLVGIGLVAGVPAALLAARPLAALLYGLQPSDPLTVATGVFVLVAAAVLASYLPARQAARVDPINALRSE
jgi:predicted permease